MCDFKDVERECYQQGSASCRNYSQLTQRVRTLALIAAVTAVAAVAAPLSDLVDMPMINRVLAPAGIVLAVIAVSLALVDWHYQSAFEAMRNVLARLEASVGMKKGPWRAHFDIRGSWRDCLASYLPFVLLFSLAILMAGRTITDGGVAYHLWVWPVFAFTMLGGVGLTFVSVKRHAAVKRDLDKTFAESQRPQE